MRGDVAAVVVSWNVRDYLRRCLLSLHEAARETAVEIWVVDNGSRDGSVAMVQQEFPDVHVLANPDNPGFAAANNQAIRASASRYVLLLNPDAELMPGALAGLCRYLDRHPRVAVVGPRLLNTDGSVQSSRRRAPRLATGFVESTQLQQYVRRSWLTDRYYVADQPDDLEQHVDWLVGACLLVRRAAIEAVGLLDEGFRFNSEELEWCWRFRRAGWDVAYLPTAQVLHHAGQSSGQDVFYRHLHHHASKYRLYALLFGRPAALLLRLWIALLYLAQFGEELAKLALLGRNRPMRRQRLRVVARMLVWHLTGAGAAGI
jgi:N-acetylglucosaminyl-diphospho-decaprenol L-rhamnosyltransferase